MELSLECEQEDDGRWLAEVLELPGVIVYGSDRVEAIAKALALAQSVLTDRSEHDRRR